MNEPITYNELVELVENNDPGTVAQVIQETHTPNSEIRELIEMIGEEIEYEVELGKWETADRLDWCQIELEEMVDP